MYHTLEFNTDLSVDIIVSRKHPLERLDVRKGTRLIAQLKPYIVESPCGPIEVADLFLEDGTITQAVPFSTFRFVDA